SLHACRTRSTPRLLQDFAQIGRKKASCRIKAPAQAVELVPFRIVRGKIARRQRMPLAPVRPTAEAAEDRLRIAKEILPRASRPLVDRNGDRVAAIGGAERQP